MAEILYQTGQQKALHADSRVCDPLLHAVFAQCNCLLAKSSSRTSGIDITGVGIYTTILASTLTAKTGPHPGSYSALYIPDPRERRMLNVSMNEQTIRALESSRTNEPTPLVAQYNSIILRI